MSQRLALVHRPLRRLLPLAAAAALLVPVGAPTTVATAQAAAPGARHLSAQSVLAGRHVDVATLPRARANAHARRTIPALRRDNGSPRTPAANAPATRPAAASPAIAVTPPPGNSVTVTINGAAGSVTSVPAGIDCPTTCSFDFGTATSVTLTATPAGGTYFAGWDNACGATSVCALTISGQTTTAAWFEAAGPAVADMSAGPTAQVGPPWAGVGDVTGCAAAPCVEPPDPWIAVGPHNIVQATNVAIEISGRAGTGATDISLPDFFLEPAGQINGGDPRVIWDSLHSRWIAVEMSFDNSIGHLYLAVSDGADPSGGWTVYRRDAAGIVFDYPGLGMSNSQVAVSWNAFALSNGQIGAYLGANLLIADADRLISAGSLPTATVGPDLSLFTWRPAVGLTYGNDLPLVVGMAKGPLGLDLGYARLTGTLAGNSLDLSATANLTSGGVALGDPPSLLAFNNPAIGPFDARPTDAVAQNGHVWVVASGACTPTGDTAVRSCVRVLDIASSATPSIAGDFTVGQAGQDAFGGGIGLTTGGSAFVAWSQSSATVRGPISTYAAYRKLDDPVNTLRQPVLVAQGSGVYAGSRWGDYLGVATDPSDPADSQVWIADEVSTAAGDWATKIAAVSQPEPAFFAGATYLTVTPSRLLDTRNGTGLAGAFSSAVPRTFQVAGRGGVPANAVAVTGNLTVTGQTRAGYVSLGPVPTSTPATSTLNFPLGDGRANGVTVPLGSGGTLSATYITGRTGDHTALIFDVTGYFLPDASGAGYWQLAPSRLLDTRVGNGLVGPFSSGVARTFQVTGRGGVPVGAVAVTGNLTVTAQTRAGYVALGPVATNAPTTSTLNFPLGDNRANGVTLPLASGGTLSATYISGRTGDHTALIFDVTGYFLPGVGARYMPVTPSRLLDTRNATGLAGAFSSAVGRTFQVIDLAGVPTEAVAVTGNLTVTAQTRAGYVALGPMATNAPTTSTLNFPVGDNRANGVTVPLSTGTSGGTLSATYITGRTGDHTALLFDVTGYFVH